jgi:hypothetical protein
MQSSVTVPRPTDRTSAAPSKSYRQEKAAAAAARRKGVTVSTAEMCALSARMDAGSVTAGDLQLAAHPVLALAQMLPVDSALALRS